MRKRAARARALRELEAFAAAQLQAARRAELAEQRRLARAARKDVKATCDAGVSELRAERAELVERRATLDSECKTEKRRVREVGRSKVAAAGDALRLQRELARDKAPKRGARLRRTRGEARAESDDAVRANLPAELVPIFNRVRHRIQAGPRMSRTDAFLHWLEEHPADVAAFEADIAELDAERLWREHEAS